LSGTRQRLSDREQQVAEAVARGLTNQQIAHEMSISVRTVDRHVANVFEKLGFSSRAQLAAWVAAQGGPIS
jgi:non-specific serine/threonine protein kinase